MTELGRYLAKRSINRSDLSRRTGIKLTRLTNLALKENANIRGDELYLISLALGVTMLELIEVIYKDLRLVE